MRAKNVSSKWLRVIVLTFAFLFPLSTNYVGASESGAVTATSERDGKVILQESEGAK